MGRPHLLRALEQQVAAVEHSAAPGRVRVRVRVSPTPTQTQTLTLTVEHRAAPDLVAILRRARRAGDPGGSDDVFVAVPDKGLDLG